MTQGDQIQVWLAEADWHAKLAVEKAEAAETAKNCGEDYSIFLQQSAAGVQLSAVYTARAMLHRWSQ
jgi:hypothetical protein